MAANPNTSRPNESTFYTARSGGGKSQAIIQNRAIRGRVVYFDPDHDYRAAVRCLTMAAFIQALKENHRRASMSIAYSGDNSPAAFELFCGAVWAVLDGDRPLHIVVDELADCVQTTGKASPKAGQLMRRARKYGGVLHLSTQRPQEVPKTMFRQCSRFWVGVQEHGDRKAMAAVAGVTEAELATLVELEFIVKEAGQEPRRVKLKYKKP